MTRGITIAEYVAAHASLKAAYPEHTSFIHVDGGYLTFGIDADALTKIAHGALVSVSRDASHFHDARAAGFVDADHDRYMGALNDAGHRIKVEDGWPKQCLAGPPEGIPFGNEPCNNPGVHLRTGPDIAVFWLCAVHGATDSPAPADTTSEGG
jgi:hypothetical protein